MKSKFEFSAVGRLLAGVGPLTAIAAAVVGYAWTHEPAKEFGPAEHTMSERYGANWQAQMISAISTNRTAFASMRHEWETEMAKDPTTYPAFRKRKAE